MSQSTLTLFNHLLKHSRRFHVFPNIPQRLLSRHYVCACKRHNVSLLDPRTSTSKELSLAQNYATIVKSDQNDGILMKLWKKLGYKGGLKYPKGMLKRGGLRLYLCTTQLIDYEMFISELDLPDTFNSWFKITQLHLWLIMVRLSELGEEGRFLRNSMMQWVWKDVEKRIKKLEEGGVSSSVKRESLTLMNEQLRFAIFSLDEGLLGTDRDLAGAVWRIIFEQDCEDPAKVEKLVRYIRKQVAYIEDQDTQVISPNGLITFLPFDGDTEDTQRTRRILLEITYRS